MLSARAFQFTAFSGHSALRRGGGAHWLPPTTAVSSTSPLLTGVARAHGNAAAAAAALRYGARSTSSSNITVMRTGCAAAVSAQLATSHRRMTEMGGVNAFEELNASRRDQESFLAQYCPLDVLGLVEGESSLRNITRAYEAKKKTHLGDKSSIDLVERAYNVLTDPQSPYYAKQTWQQGHRQRLLVELLPTTQRRQVKFYAYLWGSIGTVAAVMIMYAFLHPIVKIWRAATR